MLTWLEIVRFELAHQLRRRSLWILFGLYLIPLIGVTSDDLAKARTRDILFNAPLAIATSGIVMGLVALILIAAVAGDAATRDVRTRLEPLMHAAPVGRAAYLGGRFLGAVIVAAIVVTAVPLARILVPLAQPEVAAGVVGPFRLAPYLQSYLLLMLPNAFVATALLFALATLVRHPLGSWVGAALVFAWGQFTSSYFGDLLGRWDLAQALDPTGVNAVEVMARTWSPVDLSQRLIGAESALLLNRALWLAVACGLLVVAHRRFDFGERAGTVRWWQRGPLRPGRATRGAAPDGTQRPADGAASAFSAPVAAPVAPRTLGFAGHVRQTLAIAHDSLREAVPPWAWLLVPLVVGAQLSLTLTMLGSMGAGTPVVPGTDLVLRTLLGPDVGDTPPPVVLAMVMLPILLAGELVWRERDANMQALTDAAPVPDGVRFAGKLLGLWLVILALYALLALGAVLAQARLGWHDFEPGLYARMLPLVLVRPLLFALFALSIHVLVNQKYLGHVIVLFLVAPLIPQLLGLEHPMLILGSGPSWYHSAMSGFGPYLTPVLWFDLYWAAGALLVACVARLFWVRGMEGGLRERVRQARRRFVGPRAGAVAGALALFLLVAGFVFYNTDILNAYRTSADRAEARADYERRYGGYRGAPQPELLATELKVEIHPDRREADVRGTHY